MSLTSQYLLYLTAFRLGIIAAGVISIILGYHLFVRGPFRTHSRTPAHSLEAKVAGAGFTLKNAAPGTSFGLFGVILITVMLLQGSPELTYETLKKAATDEDMASSTKVVMRGADMPDGFSSLVQKGVDNEKKGNATKAADAYREALTGLTLPMNQLAGIYMAQGKVDDALPLARLAAQLSPANADVLDTLAEALVKHGDRAEAHQWMEKAAALDVRYRSKLAGFK